MIYQWFKRLILGSVILAQSTFAQSGYPPPCDEAQLTDIVAKSPTKRQILADYVESCEQKLWSNDKGIVMLYQYRNQQDQLCWYLSSSIDDHYKDNLPRQFMDFEGDIVLIYNGKPGELRSDTTINKSALNHCLEQIIGDRVYSRPTAKSRWTNGVLPISNHKLTVGRRRIFAGNGGALIIVFASDGTYQKILPI
ncbi:hypothetical protein SAMN06269250_3790 [Spirosoma fluviale]|uniref:Uncharacterized protein n=2 Tax=Spirosoma fluviale TaxID=1597977 RepID=A0A286G9C6_9BACT|nr:hypothetical protein SAMN06269250_3790 [Spirosoma fluviale]